MHADRSYASPAVRAILAALGLALVLAAGASAAGSGKRVLAIRFGPDLEVNPVTQDYLTNKLSKAAHDHYDAAVILLDPPVQIRAAAMAHLRTEHLPDGTGIGMVAVCRDLFRRLVDNGESAAEEPLGCGHIPRGTQHRVHQIALAINGAIQITPFAFDLEVRFVDIPAPTRFPLAFATDVPGQQRSKTFLPLPYGFMGELEPAQQKHFRQIPQAELVAQPAQHDLEHDVGRKLEVVERGARSLIRFAPTVPAAEDRVPEIRGPVQVPDPGKLAMRAKHERGSGNSGL